MLARLLTRLPAIALLSLALLPPASSGGCACDEPLNSIDDEEDEPGKGGGSLPIDENFGDGDGDGDPAELPARTLTFLGDEPAEVYFGGTLDLRYRLLDERGEPVVGETVQLLQSGTGGDLSATAFVTDALGEGGVTFLALPGNGDAIIEAQAPLAPVVSVHIAVREDPAGGLVINVEGNTRIELGHTELFVWTGSFSDIPDCWQLENDAGTPPLATFLENLVALPQTRAYEDVESGSTVTAFALGFNDNNVVIGSACVDSVLIAGGEAAHADLVIEQFETPLDGDYDVLMHMQLGGLLPEPYETYVDTATALLSDPAGYAVYKALIEVDKSTGTVFILEDNGDVPSFDDVAADASGHPGWSAARGLLEQQLIDQLGDDYYDVTAVGGGLRQVVSDFEIGARFTLDSTDDVGVYDITERWNDFVFEWPLGCPAGDLACARRAILVDDAEHGPVGEAYSGLANHAPIASETERWQVRTDPHQLALRYGAIILIVMEELVFPSLPGSIAADSLSGVLQNIVNCADVGQSIADAIGGIPLLYQGFCVAGVDLAASELEDQLLDLEAGGNDPDLAPKDQNGALAGGTFYLVDRDHALDIEDVLDFTYEVEWNDPDDPSVADEVAAPITGDGRTAASGCVIDGDCAADFTCVPVPSYLKVALLEMDCRRGVGDLNGEAPCSSNDACASGVCVDGGCFSACADSSSCESGFCSSTGLMVDLDDVLDGLGGVSAGTCLVP